MQTTKSMKPILEQLGIAYKEIECFGSQIIVTAWSESAAVEWSRALSRCATTVRGPVESRDENVDNQNTVLRPSSHTVYRVGATV